MEQTQEEEAGGGERARSDSSCDRLKLPPQTIHSSARPWYHLTSSFRDLRLFLELAPWLCFVSPSFSHLSPDPFPSVSTRLASPHLSSFLSHLVRPRNPDGAALCSRCTYAIRRHVSVIFCAADGSCRDRPTDASEHPRASRFTISAASLLPGTGYLLACCSSPRQVGILSFNRVNIVQLLRAPREPNARAGVPLNVRFSRRPSRRLQRDPRDRGIHTTTRPRVSAKTRMLYRNVRTPAGEIAAS